MCPECSVAAVQPPTVDDAVMFDAAAMSVSMKKSEPCFRTMTVSPTCGPYPAAIRTFDTGEVVSPENRIVHVGGVDASPASMAVMIALRIVVGSKLYGGWLSWVASCRIWSPDAASGVAGVGTGGPDGVVGSLGVLIRCYLPSSGAA